MKKCVKFKDQKLRIICDEFIPVPSYIKDIVIEDDVSALILKPNSDISIFVDRQSYEGLENDVEGRSMGSFNVRKLTMNGCVEKFTFLDIENRKSDISINRFCCDDIDNLDNFKDVVRECRLASRMESIEFEEMHITGARDDHNDEL